MMLTSWLVAKPPSSSRVEGLVEGIGVERHVARLEIREHQGVARVLVGDPDVGRASGELADAAAQLLLAVAPDVPVEADPRRPQLVAVGDLVGAKAVDRVDLGIEPGRVGKERNVDPQAVGDGQVVFRRPLVADVEADLLDVEARHGILAGVRHRATEAAGDARFEGVEIAELVRPEAVLDETIVEGEELVVGAEGDRMVALQPGEVVGDLDHFLVEEVDHRKGFGPGLELEIGVAGQGPRSLSRGSVADPAPRADPRSSDS